MKRRTGSWRVAKILALAVLAVFVGAAILFWLDLVNPGDDWLVWIIAIPFVLAEIAYLNLYKFPKKNHAPNPDSK